MEICKPIELTSRARVTVVVPCYNYAHYLPTAVSSVLGQQGVEADVIIVDDASTDDSVEVARRLSASHPRVRVLEHEVNRGHIQTYNDGLEVAQGDYLLLLSADDAVAPGGLARAVALMETHPSVGLVYGPALTFADSPPSSVPPDATHWSVWQGEEWAAAVCRDGRNLVPTPSAVVRASAHRKAGYYDALHPHAGDLQLWLRLAAVADVGYVAGTVQAFYREHGQNMHSQVFATDAAHGMVTDLQHRLAAFSTAMDPFPSAVRQTLLRTAQEALATQAMELAARAYVWGLTAEWPVELLQFAQGAYPGVGRTRAGRALRRRQRAGVVLSRKNPAFVAREYWLRSVERRGQAVVRKIGLPQGVGAGGK